MRRGDHRLSCFSQSHVVGKNRPPPSHKERNAFHLVGKKARSDFDRLFADFLVVHEFCQRLMRSDSNSEWF
jgi:hypothetical protein